MKVVLIQPPVEDFYHTEVRLQPLGLACLKAAVRKHLPQVEVVLCDFHHHRGRYTIPLPPELRYLRRYYPVADKSPFAVFYHYFHFGADFRTIAETVAAEKPDLVGISSLFSAYHREVLRTAESIKERLSVPIVAGGAHATAAPESLLRSGAIDWVLRGAGERPLVELLKALLSGSSVRDLPHLAYRKGDDIVLNPLQDNYALAEIGIPDFSDWEVHKYSYDRLPLAMLMTSRGCPQRCRFCSVHKVFGFRSERRDVDNIIQEIEERFKEGYRVFDFEEDHLAGDRAFLTSLCRRLRERFSAGEIMLMAMNGISHWHLDEELLLLMRQAGFVSLNLSLVSTDREVCRDLNRPHRLHSFQHCVELAHSLGFPITAYQILGLPGESLESMTDTLAFLGRLPVTIGPSPFYPVPGAPMYEEKGAFSQEELLRCRLTAFSVETADCCRDRLYTLLVCSRMINFLKNLPIEKDGDDISSLIRRKTGLSPREALGLEILDRLLQEKTLYAYSGSGSHRLEAFDYDVFQGLWLKLGYVLNQRGEKLMLTGRG